MILIIEDEKNISNLLKLELTHANYECDQAFDGESGLNKALNQDYELILLIWCYLESMELKYAGNFV